MSLKAFISGWDQIFKIRSWFWFWTQCHSRIQLEVDQWCRPHYHCCYRTDSTRGSWRVRGRGAPIPLENVGERNASTFFCWLQQPKEPDLSKSHQEIGASNNTTPATLQHWLAKPRTRYPHYSTMPNTIWHQAFQRQGTVKCGPTWSLWCSFRTTIPFHKQRMEMERQRTPRSGANSIKSLGTTLMNVAQSSHWWPRSNL